MNIEENNKLIAKFMRFSIWRDYVGFDIGTFLGKETHQTSIKIKYLRFHESWDWLMPVVEKIEEEYDYFSLLETTGIGIYEFSLSQYQRENADELELPEGLFIRTDERCKTLKDAKFEAIYKAVLEFIKWYNNEKNK